MKEGEEEVDWGDKPILPATMIEFGSKEEEEEKKTKDFADAVAGMLHDTLFRGMTQ